MNKIILMYVCAVFRAKGICKLSIVSVCLPRFIVCHIASTYLVKQGVTAKLQING